MTQAKANPAPTPAAPGRCAAVLAELLRSLDSLTVAHEELCESLLQQHAAMKRFDTVAMAGGVRRQETIHRRILRMEQQRRHLVQQLARAAGRPDDLPLVQLAEFYPESRDDLLERRTRLRTAAGEAAIHGRSCARLAGGVLSHLNAAMRILTRATTYGRAGAFDVPPARGRLEATA